MSLFDRNGVRIGPEDGKPDVVIPGMEDIRELQKLRDDFDKYRASAAYQPRHSARSVLKPEGSGKECFPQ